MEIGEILNVAVNFILVIVFFNFKLKVCNLDPNVVYYSNSTYVKPQTGTVELFTLFCIWQIASIAARQPKKYLQAPSSIVL
jgi:hypothetical protein